MTGVMPSRRQRVHKSHHQPGELCYRFRGILVIGYVSVKIYQVTNQLHQSALASALGCHLLLHWIQPEVNEPALRDVYLAS